MKNAMVVPGLVFVLPLRLLSMSFSRPEDDGLLVSHSYLLRARTNYSNLNLIDGVG